MEEKNNENKFANNILISNTSYDIISEKDTNRSYDIFPSENENIFEDDVSLQLDEEYSNYKKNIQTIGSGDKILEETYSRKIGQVKESLDFYKKMNHDLKSRREKKSLERHLQRLSKARESGLSFLEFKELFIKELEKDNNINESVRKLWI